MNLPKVENIGFIGIVIVVMLTFFYFILGFSAMMTVLGIILIFIVPLYLILDNFDLGQDEKIVFSFFLGVGIFPSIAYWLGIFISFKIAILVTFIILLIAAYLIRKFLKKQ